MRKPRSVLIALLVLAAVACSEETVEPSLADVPAVTTTIAPAVTTATTTAPAQEEGIGGLDFEYLDPATFATLELVDAGAEPREVRAWRPPVGTVVAMTTTLSSDSTQTGGGVESVSSDFTATIGATTEIVADTEEGFVARTVFDSATVSSSDPTTVSALESVYSQLIGVVVDQLTRPDGAIIAQAGIEALGEGNVLGNGLGGSLYRFPPNRSALARCGPQIRSSGSKASRSSRP